MQNKPISAIFLTIAINAVFCNPTTAEVITHWYFGLNYLEADQDIADVNITQPFFDGTLTVIANTQNTSDRDWKLFTGYQFSKYLAVEASYINLGKYKQSGIRNINDLTVSITEPTPDSVIIDVPGTVRTTFDPKGIEVVGVAISPRYYGISLRVRAGLLFSDYDANVKFISNIPALTLGGTPFPARVDINKFQENSNEIEIIAGLGIDFRIDNDWSIGLHWDRYFDLGNNDIGEQDMDVVGIDMAYHY